MKKLILLVFILGVIGVIFLVGLPLLKGAEKPEQMIAFWSDPGAMYQELTRSVGAVSMEVSKVPGVRGTTDTGKEALEKIVQLVREGLGNAFNFQLSKLPYVRDISYLKDFTFGGLILTIFGMFILVRVTGWGIKKLAPGELSVVQGGVGNIKRELSDNLWSIIIRGGGAIILVVLILDAWNSGQKNSILDVGKFFLVSLFLVVSGELAYEAGERFIDSFFKAFLQPDKAELLVLFYRLVIFAGLAFFILGVASSGQALALGEFSKWVGQQLLPIGPIIKSIFDQGVILAKDLRFIISLLAVAALVYDALLQEKVQRSA